MMNRASAPRYDLFKLLVTIVLIAILLLMLLRGCAANTVATSPAETPSVPGATQPAAALPVQTETSSVPVSTATSAASSAPSATGAIPSPTTISSTETLEAATATSAETASTPVEATATTAATEAAASAQGGEGTECNTRVPSRLAVGEAARVLQRLNMRSDPSIDAAILQTNPTGTQVEIIGGPVCTPVGEYAYLWWQIRLANGAEGWSAEMMLNDPSYLLELIP